MYGVEREGFTVLQTLPWQAILWSPILSRGELTKAFIKLRPGFLPSDQLIRNLERFAEERIK